MMQQNKISKSACSQPLAQYQHPREVRWVDIDPTGLVHFSAYTRMMEEAEYAFLRSRGLSVVLHDQRGTMGFPRTRCEIDIDRPLTLGEQVIVNVQLLRADGKRLVYLFQIVDANGKTAVTGETTAALCRFPDGKAPYAILFPPGLVEKLTVPTA